MFCLAAAAVIQGISTTAAPAEPEFNEYDEEITTAWSDTIAVINNAKRVVITEVGNKATLTVNGSGSDDSYYYRYAVEPQNDTVIATKPSIGVDIPFAGNLKHSSSSLRLFRNIYCGVNMPTGPGKDLKAGWEIAIAEVIGYGYTPNAGRTTLSAGFGFCYRSLTAANGRIFVKNGATLLMDNAPEGSDAPGATMNFWQLQFPFLLSQTVGNHDWGFNIGVILNLNVAAKGHSQWSEGDIRTKISVDNLHQRFFTPDIFASMGMRDCVGFYIKFSPMNAMLRYSGPRMSMLSAGINLNF